jgi:hypothetical protein
MRSSFGASIAAFELALLDLQLRERRCGPGGRRCGCERRVEARARLTGVAGSTEQHREIRLGIGRVEHLSTRRQRGLHLFVERDLHGGEHELPDVLQEFPLEHGEVAERLL